ncbi:HAD-IA family hydrolase [Adhaeribacter soli]|uniref:HAD-IA family hydrolase n=1 Tax=Adhaeribacter soli TaxID=2607655 RepID=A0A5N1IP57_9BACT|nr:HAD-IA family hydrolase [Adhaeribacter soli]KAA9331751.1 HAD-IA family hydrolase [Adhaeribacter soli]
MQAIKFVVFDFDGTLADSKHVAISAINQLADRHHYKPIRPEALEQLRKLSIAERCRLLGWPVYKLPFLAAELYQLYKHSLHEINLFPGIRELLTELQRNNIQVAILSSNSEQNIRTFLQANNLEFVQHVICSNRIFGKDKMLRKFLKTHQLQPQNVLYAGDEVRDVIACKKCGIKISWVSWGFDSQELVQSENPDFIVHSPEEILGLLSISSKASSVEDLIQKR